MVKPPLHGAPVGVESDPFRAPLVHELKVRSWRTSRGPASDIAGLDATIWSLAR
jgi:hypothetical protein